MTPDLQRLIAVNAYQAYIFSLRGSLNDEERAWYERTTHPVAGDLVIEWSTFWSWARDPKGTPGAALGVLLRVAREPIISKQVHDELLAGGDYYDHPGESYEAVPTEPIFYLCPLDGSVPEFRWHNASFIAVLSSRPE